MPVYVAPPAIPQFPAGYGPSPSDFGNWVTDTLGFQTTGILFRGEQTSPQTFPTAATAYTISFDTVLEDPFGGWNAGSNYWLAPYSGWYEVSVFASITAVAANLQVLISVSGVRTYTFWQAGLSSATVGGGCGFARVYLAGSSDYVQGQVRASVNSVTSDVSAIGRFPMMEIAYISQ